MSLIRSSLMKWITGGLLVALLAGGLALALPSQVFAATTPPQKATPEEIAARLEKRYQNEQKAAATQGTRIDRLTGLLQKASTRIDALQAKGLDVAVLRDALKAAQDRVTAAGQYRQAALDILTTHTGFDANGKVTDAALARKTLTAAAAQLKNAHQQLTPTLKDLHQAIRQFVQENRKSNKK